MFTYLNVYTFENVRILNNHLIQMNVMNYINVIHLNLNNCIYRNEYGDNIYFFMDETNEIKTKRFWAARHNDHYGLCQCDIFINGGGIGS